MIVRVATKERAVDRGIRNGRKVCADIGQEIRSARIAAGLSQAALGRAARSSQAAISRMEAGESSKVGVGTLSRVLAVLGLRLSLKAYPQGPPVRDAAHGALLQKLRRMVDPKVKWRFEVPVSADPDDLRAWDSEIQVPVVTRVEAETRLHDIQALQRRLELKQRDGSPGYVILLVAGTHANRRILREDGAVLRLAYPLATAQVLAALRAGRDPGANGIVVL
jgi:transcriptional regulator with XRE-family HTH domain